MLTLTTVAIQESPELRAVNADKGITKEMFKSDRVLLADEVHAAVRSKMAEALADYIDQIADEASYDCDTSAVDFTHIRESMQANIDNFKLDAGTGYTSTHKANLIALGQCEAIDFIAPKKRGDGTATASVSAKSGVLSL